METITLGKEADPGLMEELERRTGTNVARCLQCGKCTAGCPMNFLYDISVNQVMRLAREGDRKALLSSRSVWLCASCHTCTARCPAGIEPSAIMETLRHMALSEQKASEPDPRIFADAFLATLKRWGRMYEIELMTRYNLGSRHLLSGADLAPIALSKGKLHFMPPRVEGAKAVARIVERFQEEQKR